MEQPSQQKGVVQITEADIRLLRIFRVVAESGGLTAAERKLNMERSTISRHIKALEQRLNGILCVRGPGGFQLTDFGLVVLQAAISTSDVLDHVSEKINSARTVLTGDLIVGVADNCLSNPDAKLPESISAFRRSAPGVKLQIVIQPPRQLIEGLLTRNLHLCIVGGPLVDERLSFQYLFKEDFYLYAGSLRGRPVPTLDSLVSDGWILVMREGDRYTRALNNYLDQPIRAMASGLEAIATLISAGGHVGFLPHHYASALAMRADLHRVLGARQFEYTISFQLTVESARPMSAQARLFCNALVEAHLGSGPIDLLEAARLA